MWTQLIRWFFYLPLKNDTSSCLSFFHADILSTFAPRYHHQHTQRISSLHLCSQLVPACCQSPTSVFGLWVKGGFCCYCCFRHFCHSLAPFQKAMPQQVLKTFCQLIYTLIFKGGEFCLFHNFYFSFTFIKAEFTAYNYIIKCVIAVIWFEQFFETEQDLRKMPSRAAINLLKDTIHVKTLESRRAIQGCSQSIVVHCQV